MVLYAITRGYADDVEVNRVLEFTRTLISDIEHKNAALLDKIEQTKDLDADSEKALVAAIEAFKSAWV